jgi:hypothetical protein
MKALAERADGCFISVSKPTPLSQNISKQVQDYKDEIAQSLSEVAVIPVERELPKKVKKPAARKTK